MKTLERTSAEVIRPDFRIDTIKPENDLYFKEEELENAVDGKIAHLYSESIDCYMIINKDQLDGTKEFNSLATEIYKKDFGGKEGESILGKAVICPKELL